MKSGEVQLVLIEDNLLFAKSVFFFFQSLPRYRLVKHYTNCREAFRSECMNGAHILLLDIGLPEMNGIDAIPVFLKKFPHLQIIMLSSFSSDKELFLSLKNGARGYILKSDYSKFLENAIEQVWSGGTLFSPEMAQKVLNSFKPKSELEFNLTVRENDVLYLLRLGMTKKEIAIELNISYNTVDTHVKSIYKKLHVNSNVQAVRLISEK